MSPANFKEQRHTLSTFEAEEIEKNELITTALQLSSRLTGLQIIGLRQSQPKQWLGYMERRNVQLDFKEHGLISSHLDTFDELIGEGEHEILLGSLDPEDEKRKLICRLNSSIFIGIPIHTSQGYLFGNIVGMTEIPMGRLEIIETRKSLKLVCRLIASMRSAFETPPHSALSTSGPCSHSTPETGRYSPLNGFNSREISR